MTGQGKPLRKVCQHCKQDKRLNEYYYNRTKPDHHSGICKHCQLAVNKQNKGA